MNKADNLPMSAEEWYESETKQGYCFIDIFDFAYLYSDYLLSHHINVLAERKYSEEDVLEQLNLLYSMKNSLVDTFTDKNDRITKKWFEQFKK